MNLSPKPCGSTIPLPISHAAGWIRCVLAVIAFVAAIPYAWAQKVALLVGNNDYKHAGVLKSPIRDALDMDAVLRKNGFSVLTLVNANLEEMGSGIRSLTKVGAESDVCLFYFSGHGCEVDGINYLSPVDSLLQDRSDLDRRFLSLGLVLQALQQTEAQRKIVILDCCRSDPFKGVAGGLAAVEAGLLPRGTFIVYAGSPGLTVPDGGGGANSPYTAEVLRQLSPGRDVFSIFTSVSALRFRSQDPWISFDGGAQSLRDLSQYDLLGARGSRPAPDWPRIQRPVENPAPRAVVPDAKPMKIASYWDHNGSTMGLLVQGERRLMVYIKVRAGLQGLVEPGMVLFDGVSKSNRYSGQARRFSRGLKPLEYPVSGPILENGNRVIVTGKAPIRNPDGSTKAIIEDRLEFRFLQLED